jgi:regulator of sirC expression with transglutaminase-like and TPR domain
MKRRALLLLLASSGCRGGAARLPFSRKLLAVTSSAAKLSDAEVSDSVSELMHLADMAREALAAAPSQPPATVVSQLLFGRLGFEREVDDQALKFVLLPSVLRQRRGSCVGLGTLFLALSEALGWSASGVMMPGHFYVRVADSAQHRNVELLRKGEAMPDAWYSERFPIPGGAAPEYARPLRAAEVLGVLEYNVGNDHRRARRVEPARAAFARSVAAFPDFSEAHASLGAMQQLLGQLEQAAQSYRVALAKNPHLPGLDQNLTLLRQEREPVEARP